jgi:hypothetical protein
MAHSRTCAPSLRFHPVRPFEKRVPLCARPTPSLSAGLVRLRQTSGAAGCTKAEVQVGAPQPPYTTGTVASIGRVRGRPSLRSGARCVFDRVRAQSALRAAGRGGTVVLYSLAAGGTLIIYLRFVCGWRLGDLMYVTRASLSRSLTSVTSGTASARRCRPAGRTCSSAACPHPFTPQPAHCRQVPPAPCSGVGLQWRPKS